MRNPNPLLVLALLIAPLAAQRGAAPQAPTPTPPDMTQQPAIGAMPTYAPPKNDVDQLSNGLRIMAVEDDRFPQVNIRLSLRAGNSRLTPDQAGLADAEAALLTAGVPNRTALQLAQYVDTLGGDIGASAGPDFLQVDADALSNHADELMQVLAQVVLHPTFPQNEVDLRKGNMRQELEENRADPDFLAGLLFNKLLFGANSYAITAPTEASIDALNRDALVAFHDKYFVPDNRAVIVIVGNIKPAHAEALVHQYFNDWKAGKATPPASPDVPALTQTRVCVIDRPGSAQTTLLIGNLGITRLSPDYYAFTVIDDVLGGGFNSRLLSDIREKQGLAYDIGSHNQANRDLGEWLVSTQTRTAATGQALQATLDQLNRIRATPPSPLELQQAKNYLSGGFMMSLETQSDVADQFLRAAIYGVPDNYLGDWVTHIQDVSADAAQSAAERHISPNAELIVAVGDAKQIAPQLAPLAPDHVVHYYDDAGNPIAAPGGAPAQAGGGGR